MQTATRSMTSSRLRWPCLCSAIFFLPGLLLAGEPTAVSAPPLQDEHHAEKRLPPPDPVAFPGLKRLQPDADVWLDPENKRVVVQAGVCLREGAIEMFACNHRWIKDPVSGQEIRSGTKEYESIITINASAAVIHAALLAVGARSGSPVRFVPRYEPAHGSVIHVTLHWRDAQGRRCRAKAQQWVRNTASKQPLEHDWVFAGSRLVDVPDSDKKFYLADSGNVICVSNFTDAMLDLPIASTQVNERLLFEAFTEHIPALGTPITVVLEPGEDGNGGQGGAGPMTNGQNVKAPRQDDGA
jgi:hypothetical protein